jgi:hypothetical protein
MSKESSKPIAIFEDIFDLAATQRSIERLRFISTSGQSYDSCCLSDHDYPAM